ncbi:MAG: hypothetical protein E5Y02_14740 [Mesorhizobium sp.]|nr:MAG: hypothetical protein E5Y02_14740 [Mesorhizobium sp.]
MSIANAAKARHRANRTGKMKVGRCVLADKPKPTAPFMVTNARLRELERVIATRYGTMLPETDDADLFIEVAAYSLNAHCLIVGADLDKVLTDWCHRWAPWALRRAGTIIRPILNRLVGRRYQMKADEAARKICLTLVERTALEIKTMGACDFSARVRKGVAKDVKRSGDRARQTAKRRARGVEPRESWLAKNSLSKGRPWDAEGISRAQWYRRYRETGPSLVGISTQSDTLVSSVSMASPLGSAPVVLALPSKSLPSLKSRHGAVSANGGAEQCDGDEVLRQMGVAS